MKKLLIVLLFLFSVSAFGDKLNLDRFSVGQTVSGRGSFYVERNNVIDKIGLSENIILHDTIITDERSFVIVQFTDGTKLTVRPNSKVKIEEYSYYNEESDRVEISILEGGLRMLTGAITKNDPEGFKLKTPVALMGVRGTEFSIMICEDKKNVCSVEEIN